MSAGLDRQSPVPMTPSDAAGALFDASALLKAALARLDEMAGQPFGDDEANEVCRVVRMAQASVYEVGCAVADFKLQGQGAQS